MEKQQQHAVNATYFTSEENRALFSTENLIRLAERGEKYLLEQPFKRKEVFRLFSNEGIINSLLSFLENGQNITKSSEQSFVHRNTIVYRLKKIQRVLGIDLHVFSDAVLFQNLVICFREYKKR